MTQTRSPRGGPRQTSRKLARQDAGARKDARKDMRLGPGKPSRPAATAAAPKPFAAKTQAAKAAGPKTAAPKTAAPKAAAPKAASPKTASPKTAAPKPATASPSPKRVQKAATSQTLATGIQTLVVEPDEQDMRLDRFLSARFPQLAFTHIQRIIRTGQLRVDGKRVKPNDRIAAGASVRVPPLKMEEQRPRSPTRNESDLEFIKGITLYEDGDVLVIDKPAGLASQGGSGTTRHVDGLLEAMRNEKGEKPRLVHRLDKETAGCLVIAKSRFAASVMAKSFRSRATRKVYWAIVAGVPKTRQGRVSTYIAKEMLPDGDSRMRVAEHGDEGAEHALTYYAVIEQSGQKLSWVSLKPVTGRTHQLRVHAASIGHPIIGDPKYFNVENWELPGGIQNRLHLLARRIVVPHPRTGKPIDVTAPLPPHMQQTFNLLGLETDAYDPIVEAPEA